MVPKCHEREVERELAVCKVGGDTSGQEAREGAKEAKLALQHLPSGANPL